MGSTQQAKPTGRGKRRGLIIAAIIVGLGGAAAVAAVTVGGDTPHKTVHGELVLADSDTADARCVGQGGYSDITPGATVILTNQDGKILGSGALDEGKADESGDCTYTFTIADVPDNQAQYAVEVTHRGKIVNSRKELVANHWTFELSLGN